MNQPLSRTKIAKLGDELRERVVEPDSEWWTVYETYLDRCEVLRQELQSRITRCLVGKKVSISGRTKTRDTLREKLRKFPDINLGSIDDVIGVRVVGDFSLLEQDEIAEILKSEFGLNTKVKDRRENPVEGYRALHLIVRIEEMHAEIQIRTTLQSQWADLFEKSADLWGRQIRYGQPPNYDSEEVKISRESNIRLMKELSIDYIAHVEVYVAEDLKMVSDREETRALIARVPSKEDFRSMTPSDRAAAFKQKTSARHVQHLQSEIDRLVRQRRESIQRMRVAVDGLLSGLASEVK